VVARVRRPDANLGGQSIIDAPRQARQAGGAISASGAGLTDPTGDHVQPTTIRRRSRRNPSQAPAGQLDLVNSDSGLLVNEHGELIAGHGRYEAAKQLGLTQVPVIVVDFRGQDSVRLRLRTTELPRTPGGTGSGLQSKSRN
jgi:hypothetical protein